MSLRPWIGVTGFSGFAEVVRNPSGEVARALEHTSDPLPIRAAVLPVTLSGAPRAFDAWLAESSRDAPPVALLSLGIHRGREFRLERRASGELRSPKPDSDGVVAAHFALDGAARVTSLDLGALALALAAPGGPGVRVSEDAGGFVCERLYHHVLERAGEVCVPALFLHVPPAHVVGVERQALFARRLLRHVLAQARG